MVKEVCFGDHHGVKEATVVCTIFHFFGGDVASLDLTGNVSDEGRFGLLSFTDTIVLEVDVLGSFVGECRGPISASLVVIVDSSKSISLWDINASCSKFDTCSSSLMHSLAAMISDSHEL